MEVTKTPERGKRVAKLNCILGTHCGNYGNMLSPIFGKNFVKSTI